MKIKFIQQYDETDCAPTCLAMISKYYGKKLPVSKIREYAKTDKQGTNLFGLIEAGKKIGLSLEGYEACYDDLEDFNYPLIAHVINEKGYDHFVIIEKKKEDTLYIVDPDKGKYKISTTNFQKLWTNIILTVEKNERFNTESDYPSASQFLKDNLKGNYSILFLVVLISLFINLIGILGAFFLQLLTDYIIPSNVIENLHKIALGFLLLFLANALIQFIRFQLILHISLKIDLKLMRKYLEVVLKLPTNFFETRKNGEILSRFTDITKIREALSSVAVTLLVDSLMIIIGGIILYMQNTRLFFIIAIFLPIFIISFILLKKPFDKYNRKSMEMEAEMNSELIDTFNGSNIIKNFNAEKHVAKKNDFNFKKYIDQVNKLNVFSNIQVSLNDLLKALISIFVLWIGSYDVIKGNMTLGSMLAFNALVLFYLSPLERLINVQATIQSAIVAARRMMEITELETEEVIKKNSNEFKFEDKILIENLSFQYGYRSIVLHNINLKIEKGKKIALVGESGSGKSTIGKILSGYYSDYQGEIYIDNTNIKEIKLHNYRNNVSYVSQTTFLFNDTIINNLKIGNNSVATNDQILSSCKQAFIHDFIADLPHQYETMIDRDGESLSGGQQQRISIARALIKNSPIYIFDEATSALDSLSESYVLKAINNLVEEGKTVLVISHKLKNIIDADLIYTLKDGELIEEGTHDQLISKKGLYYNMVKSSR
ncbi:peptidase domain-containing ABC transporter [Staphylococcus xylosus]|uniref:peptidase domain-containing ABC transporter n=1 Tax=Staphylococcus xylosus TaxID=1288 RepID=UPI001642BC4A|nr:peptidase domain-containing ABC transporter [Staphylococcus xylosus]MCD8851402.1 peptidase domain-containing ABC transporter [Staphylococcus xylosus]MEB6319790.1 peptidase domain-containing ABC transporter [Staphylococcus xylosus]MEB7507208.1 peptidase domain-containing ABC transporter [Staphylococcus xylosus]MEB8059660.1 peptidase domain-containing ABC transporter [Staphylococcus xylosus]